MSPCSSVTDAPSTALNLPKALVTSRASRSMRCSRRNCCLRSFAAPCPEPLDQGQNAARLKARDQHDDRAVHDERQTRALATKQIVGAFLQRHQDGSAQ